MAIQVRRKYQALLLRTGNTANPTIQKKMIISDKYRFVFIHIPKCAGMTIQNQLQSFDDTNGAHMGKVANHHKLGPLDYVHIPLSVMRDHFPSEFQRLLTYNSFAVIRDPFQRFPSSFAQYLRMYKKKELRSLSNKELQKEIDDVLVYLSSNQTITDPKFIHLEKQTSFVDLDGEPVVKNLYHIDDVAQLISDIGKIVNKELSLDVNKNVTLVYRNKLISTTVESLRPTVGSIISQVFPGACKRWVRGKVYSIKNNIFSPIFDSSHIKDFIRFYYNDDFLLLNNDKRQYRKTHTGNHRNRF